MGDERIGVSPAPAEVETGTIDLHSPEIRFLSVMPILDWPRGDRMGASVVELHD